MRELHCSPYPGHSGVKRTCELIGWYFWWPTMPANVTGFVEGCVSCQMNKSPAGKKASAMHQNPVMHQRASAQQHLDVVPHRQLAAGCIEPACPAGCSSAITQDIAHGPDSFMTMWREHAGPHLSSASRVACSCASWQHAHHVANHVSSHDPVTPRCYDLMNAVLCRQLEPMTPRQLQSYTRQHPWWCSRACCPPRPSCSMLITIPPMSSSMTQQ